MNPGGKPYQGILQIPEKDTQFGRLGTSLGTKCGTFLNLDLNSLGILTGLEGKEWTLAFLILCRIRAKLSLTPDQKGQALLFSTPGLDFLSVKFCGVIRRLPGSKTWQEPYRQEDFIDPHRAFPFHLSTNFSHLKNSLWHEPDLEVRPASHPVIP